VIGSAHAAPGRREASATVDARRGRREGAAVAAGFAALTILFTAPLAFHLGSVGRVDNGDGQFSIWNVAWVARTLIVDPRHVLDANIFYPHLGTLTYSETNLGAGALAVPIYWASRNPYAAHNFVLLLSFVASAAGMYYLVRYLAGDRRAAAVAGVLFGFCPYVLAHTPHIQLLMTAGLPFALLSLHRLFDRPSPGRGAALGAVMAAQAYFCGYYAIFLVLLVGFAVLALMLVRRRWTDTATLSALAVAATLALVGALPLIAAYASHQRTTGFTRSLESAREFSATWRDYFASSSYAHAPLLHVVGHGATADMLFPGFVAVTFALVGGWRGWTRGGRMREIVLIYGGAAVAAAWLSFGPAARLYSLLYATVPGFTFMRAPSRFGLVVVFAACVLAGVGLASAFGKARGMAIVAVGILGVAELIAPLRFPPVRPPDEAYRVLATMPPGAVLELPVYSRQFGFVREAYMLNSTIHWKPLIDAYSDYIPPDFTANMEALGGFPSRDAFRVLASIGGRYAVIHADAYNPAARAQLLERLKAFAPYLQARAIDGQVWLYEIVGFP